MTGGVADNLAEGLHARSYARAEDGAWLDRNTDVDGQRWADPLREWFRDRFG